MKVFKVADKVFVGKDIIHAEIFKKLMTELLLT